MVINCSLFLQYTEIASQIYPLALITGLPGDGGGASIFSRSLVISSMEPQLTLTLHLWHSHWQIDTYHHEDNPQTGDFNNFYSHNVCRCNLEIMETHREKTVRIHKRYNILTKLVPDHTWTSTLTTITILNSPMSSLAKGTIPAFSSTQGTTSFTTNTRTKNLISRNRGARITKSSHFRWKEKYYSYYSKYSPVWIGQLLKSGRSTSKRSFQIWL